MFSIRINSNLKFGIYLQQKCPKLFSTENIKQPNKKSSEFRKRFWTELSILSSTPEWRKAADIITNEEIGCNRPRLTIFNKLMKKAFLEGDRALGWEMLTKINANNFQPNCEAFQAYWDFCTVDKNTFPENIEKMLEFIGKNELILSEYVIEELSHRVEHFGGSAVRTSFDNEGVCKECQHQIPQLQQSALEFHTLKREFEKVLLKQKITFVELGVFRQMVNKKKTFDYIVDALNVACVIPDSKGDICRRATLLERLVKQLRAQNKRVLIVGRKHIEEWPEQSINFIRKNATVYLTNQPGMNDDILMMYGALISGQNAHFVTNDLLLDYPPAFSEEGKQLFRNWQKQHQHFISCDEANDTIQIHRPKRFMCNANKIIENGRWHIPFTGKPLVKSLGGLIRVPIKWICVKLNTNH